MHTTMKKPCTPHGEHTTENTCTHHMRVLYQENTTIAYAFVSLRPYNISYILLRLISENPCTNNPCAQHAMFQLYAARQHRGKTHTHRHTCTSITYAPVPVLHTHTLQCHIRACTKCYIHTRFSVTYGPVPVLHTHTHQYTSIPNVCV